ncbi:PfkB family carbohydrate kinase [Niastella populi]|uniref:PfkB family carbohydrate kinase n=1 Tax=Niastella populi TaxID=550983 RepID=UPI0009BD1D48|nr:PfkB family carbohydrate kinase [Niastella populi]
MSDHTISKKLVCYGELLWDLLPAGEWPGGAPMNVAYHLHKLKCDTTLISRVGKDKHGAGLIALLSQWGMSTDYISTNRYHPTGIVYAHAGDGHEMKYDIVFPSAWDHIIWDERFTSLMQDSEYLVFGSLACRNHTSANTLFALLEAAKTKVLDINLRPPHFSYQVVEQLLHKANILKLNLEELELIAGRYAALHTVADKVQLLQDRFGIGTIVVTLGASGAMLNMDGNIYRHPGYRIQVADTVGSGDAFLAGMLSKLIDAAPPAAMLDFACAMGALIASYTGACPNYHAGEIEKVKNFSRAEALFTQQPISGT